MKRPLLAGCLSYVLTIAVAVTFLSDYLTAAIAITATAAVLFLLLSLRFKSAVKLFYITAVSLLAIASLSIFNHTTILAADSLHSKTVDINATIIETGQSSSGKPYYVVRLHKVNGEKAARGLNAQIYSSDYEQYNDYDKINVKVNFFDEDFISSSEKYYMSNNIFASGIATGEIVVINSEEFSLLREICKFRDNIIFKLRTNMNGQEANIACGILFGRRDLIDEDIIDLFSTAGISHLLAVSGLHLTIIIMLLEAFLKKLRVNKHIRSIIAILLAFTMMIMTGFTPSIVRAGIMTSFLLIARVVRRDYDSITILSFAALIICMANPYVITNVGFQLSFSATLGIIVSNRVLEKIRSRFSMKTVNIVPLFFYEVLKMALPCFFAFIFTAPITAYTFGYISTYSPIVNLLISPLLPALMAFIIFSAIFAFLPGNFLSHIIFEITRLIISCIVWVAEEFSRFKFAKIYIQNDLIIPCTIAIILMIIIAIKSKRPARNCICAILLSVCIICTSLVEHLYSYRDTYKLSIIDSSVVLEDENRMFITGYNKDASYQLNRLISRSGNKKLCLVSAENPSGKDITSLSHFLFDYKVDAIIVPKEYEPAIKTLNLDPSYKLYSQNGLNANYDEIDITTVTYGKNTVVFYDIEGFKIAKMHINSRDSLPAGFECDLLIANSTTLPFIEHYKAKYFLFSEKCNNPNHLGTLLSKYGMKYIGDVSSGVFYIRENKLFKRAEIF